MKSKGLKRRAIRKKPGSKPPEYIQPKHKRRGASFSTQAEYQYFYGHIVPEVAKKLPSKKVVCWYNDHILSLPICAMKKFWGEKTYCKRCTLFQDDEYAQELKTLIEEWECDDPKEDES